MKHSSAVILSGYGMGNLPTSNKKLMNMIHKAVEDGVIVVIKTQCHHGTVSDVYATGRFLTSMGCILAQDMTTECLFAKLSYLLGKGYTSDRIKILMKQSLRGELTSSLHQDHQFELANSDMVLAVANYLNVTDNEDINKINSSITPVLVNSVAKSGNLELLQKLHR